jgi:hypothetical protein
MQRRKLFRFLMLLNILVVVSLACAVTNTVNTARQIGEGIETVQGIATQIDESGIKETAQAAATEIIESGAVETAQAALTEVVVKPDDLPEDVPLMDGYFALVGTDTDITYSINEEYQSVIDFYRTQMPALGWTETKAEISDSISNLSYEKNGRTADFILTEVPILGTIQVVIGLK